MNFTEEERQKLKRRLSRVGISFKWILFAILSGILIGGVCTAFTYCLRLANETREAHPLLIFALPAGGILIVFLYRVLHDEKDTGTNLVLSTIHSGDHIPLRMAPSIFLATLITHLFGGSAGREGAALQLGGSIGSSLGRLFRFDEKDQHIMIMSGMSAGFSALLGTPMAAAIFSMEVVSVGIMHYSALVPCVIAALVARGVASLLGVPSEGFLLSSVPAFSVFSGAWTAALAILSAFVSILFCVMLHQSDRLFQKFFKNPYLRIAVGGAIIVLLTLLVGDQRYNGSGIFAIEGFLRGEGDSLAFLIKIVFTAITIGAGFKGGEIVPSFFIGAAFGCLFGRITGMDPGLSAAVGMTSVFCGVTNCPITSLLISFELFGYQGMPYFLLAVSLSYMLSGYYGLYSSQKIIYSKYKTNYINKNTH